MKKLIRDIEACRICAERFAATATAHEPRPVIRMAKDARILIAGQAPGLRVHETGIPFNDPSGDRLRDWMSVDRETFYDPKCCAIIPMAFCFPGYDAKGSDLPPPKICAQTWRSRVIKALGEVRLTLVIGGYAQRWHMGGREGVTARVQNWRAHAPQVFPLPHPSWRNTAWLKKNPWFEAELLPELRVAVQRSLQK
ncbi:uracil-DNA glycosylase family protein [Aquicoccus sp. G2-2]|uniref:uracil-DNA glycosylase family protein n=1 Tax=Aquicoccus sp. G2-2 TaxID=3092120 RepID=UPI002ADF4E8A|nr:uracil-DNA glycosylase family protein [Aquicoccus sp. G2-2]MEA1112442.1 uracil-DNA glycosylase family protein [Aquicoccus sp. G2-2]